jgi:hypothetical protein
MQHYLDQFIATYTSCVNNFTCHNLPSALFSQPLKCTKKDITRISGSYYWLHRSKAIQEAMVHLVCVL